MTSSRRIRRVLLAAVALAAVDLASKAAAVAWLDDPMPIGGGFSLRLVRNPGIAFGLAAGVPPALILVVTSAVALLLVYLVARGQIEPPAGAALLLAGAAANIIDRAQDGSVVDMIDLGWWPSFNLADTFIVTGVGLVLLWSFRHPVSDDPRSEIAAEGSKP